MQAIRLVLSCLTTLIICGCLESNPQPSPAGEDLARQESDTEGPNKQDGAATPADSISDSTAPDQVFDDLSGGDGLDLCSDASEVCDAHHPDGCIPDCEGRECGPDGCGGVCGKCPNLCSPCGEPLGGPYLPCSEGGMCPMGCCPICCEGRQCGSDGCGGTCGTCGDQQVCGDDAQCYPKSCQPQCDGKECGPDGCGSMCGWCPYGAGCSPNGNCVVGGDYVAMSVQCAHVPYVLAGQSPLPVPIAVAALIGGCDAYHHAEATVDGSNVYVTLLATPELAPCPPCIYSYAGIVWVSLDLDPGQYTLYVGEDPTPHPMLVSFGDITAPSCDDACPPIPTEDWVMTLYLPKAGAPTPSCSLPGNGSAPVELSGGCQHWDASITGLGLTPTTPFYMCDENLVFPAAEGTWEPSATHCVLPGDGDGQEVHWILGIEQHPLAAGPEPALFMWQSKQGISLGWLAASGDSTP